MLSRAVAEWLELPGQSSMTARAMAGRKARRTTSARLFFMMDPPPDREPAATEFPLRRPVKQSGQGVRDDSRAARLAADLRQRAGVERDQVPALARQADAHLLEAVGDEPRVELAVERDPDGERLRRLDEEAGDPRP